MANGTQIDTTTGLKVVDTSSIMQLANGAYLNTATNILTMADGTQIDTVTADGAVTASLDPLTSQTREGATENERQKE